MAELIDKKTLREEIESLTVHVTGLRAGKGVLSKFMDEYRKSVLRIIDEQPTATEAEIGAKAISEFAKRVRHKIMSEIDECADELEWITEIEWQLKEEQ